MSSDSQLLILEDDQVFRERLAKAFKRRAFEVVETESCAKALETIKTTPFTHGLLDLALPDGSGVAVLEKLLLTNPEAKAVVLTGYGTIATAVEATRCGALDYLTKPCTIEEILAAFNGVRSISKFPTQPSLAQVEWEHLQRVLNDNDGNITKAAAALGLHRRSLQRKLSKDPGKLD